MTAPTPPAELRFEFATAARIIFGTGVAEQLPQLARELGRRPLLVTGANPARWEKLRAAIAGEVENLSTVSISAEPTVAVIENAVRDARGQRCDCVIAIGGGSVIDAGKAIAALTANDGPAIDYLEVVGRGRPLERASLPFLAAPTTAGTGAEVTRNAVLAVPESRVKVSLRSAHMLPRLALVDPLLALDLPPAITAATGMDALTQLIEPFVSCRAQPMTDALCRDGIARAALALPVAFRSPHDRAARADLALAALYSGMALANAGLGAVHGFAAPIGGSFSAPHGAVCAALLPHVLAANVAALEARAPDGEALRRVDEVGRLLSGNAHAGRREAISFCRTLVDTLHIPPLSRWGVAREHIRDLAAQAAKSSSMKGNPLPLTEAELHAILEQAI